jgi:hypothetical protein
MAMPEINFNSDGSLTICCGDEPCAIVRVGTARPAQPPAAEPPVLQPTPLKPTIAYAQLVDAYDAGRMDIIAGHIDLYIEREAGVMALAVPDGGAVRLEVLNAVEAEFGLTPTLHVGASVELPAYA